MTQAVTVPEGTLARVAKESQLKGASRSQILRFALLSMVMGATEARDTVLGREDDLTETSGRVHTNMPEHEVQMVKDAFPDMAFSDIARYALGLAAGEAPRKAFDSALAVKRGPKPRKNKAV